MAQPVVFSAQPSIHQPSRMESEGNAVECGLHAGGAGGLVGAAWGVDPDVDALGEECAELPVIVFEVIDLEGRGVELEAAEAKTSRMRPLPATSAGWALPA